MALGQSKFMTDSMVGMVDTIDAGGGNLFVDMKKDRGGPSLGQYWTFLAKTFFETTAATR